MQKIIGCLLVLVAPLVPGHPARADADDARWVNQCIADNKGGAADSVVMAYCACMNNKMGDNETRSITEWEKSHPAERKSCERTAGWK
ncbi:conserved exported protein of unknown function [Rhodovastum atsumiense]|uniref:Uncharacterized protein n=1 Tax=Rhodovastum atsumiense TaxID=504468 RepID=A0A5M6IKK5_9PROT|nr:hypothetical protein [Rhodovastum atsumiense]KAA5608786.1 hypothetical protein F1189_27480 [Rhodovastum atsumiense]CAH2602861.1 conserved exported protein of unknown function [Rhodovastum atsumiense]